MKLRAVFSSRHPQYTAVYAIYQAVRRTEYRTRLPGTNAAINGPPPPPSPVAISYSSYVCSFKCRTGQIPNLRSDGLDLERSHSMLVVTCTAQVVCANLFSIGDTAGCAPQMSICHDLSVLLLKMLLLHLFLHAAVVWQQSLALVRTFVCVCLCLSSNSIRTSLYSSTLQPWPQSRKSTQQFFYQLLRASKQYYCLYTKYGVFVLVNGVFCGDSKCSAVGCTHGRCSSMSCKYIVILLLWLLALGAARTCCAW